MRRVLILAMLAGCSNNAALEQRVSVLETTVRELNEELASKAADAVMAAPSHAITDEVADQGRQLGDHESRLARVDSYLELLGAGAHVDGWWCGRGACGRTVGECEALERRMVFVGRKPVTKDCTKQPTAFCKLNGLDCYSTSRDECIEIR